MSKRYIMYQILQAEMNSILILSFFSTAMGFAAGFAWMLPGLPDGIGARLFFTFSAIACWFGVFTTIRRVKRETTFEDEQP